MAILFGALNYNLTTEAPKGSFRIRLSSIVNYRELLTFRAQQCGYDLSTRSTTTNTIGFGVMLYSLSPGLPTPARGFGVRLRLRVRNVLVLYIITMMGVEYPFFCPSSAMSPNHQSLFAEKRRPNQPRHRWNKRFFPQYFLSDIPYIAYSGLCHKYVDYIPRQS